LNLILRRRGLSAITLIAVREPVGFDLGRSAHPERGLSTARVAEEQSWIVLAPSIRLFHRRRLSSSTCDLHYTDTW
jgi:hypothetical protein